LGLRRAPSVTSHGGGEVALDIEVDVLADVDLDLDDAPASYLAGLDRLSKLHYSTAATLLVVLAFNLVMLILLEAPLMAFAVAPARTPSAVDQAKAWAGRRGRLFSAIRRWTRRRLARSVHVRPADPQRPMR
jgi:hypothetical protein